MRHYWSGPLQFRLQGGLQPSIGAAPWAEAHPAKIKTLQGPINNARGIQDLEGRGFRLDRCGVHWCLPTLGLRC